MGTPCTCLSHNTSSRRLPQSPALPVTHLMETRLSFSQALGGPAAGAPVRSYLARQSRPLLSSPLANPSSQRTRECGWPKHPAPLWKHRKTWLEPSWLVTILPYFVQLCPSSQWPQATWETNASRCFIWTNTSQLGKAAASSVFLALA